MCGHFFRWRRLIYRNQQLFLFLLLFAPARTEAVLREPAIWTVSLFFRFPNRQFACATRRFSPRPEPELVLPAHLQFLHDSRAEAKQRAIPHQPVRAEL